MLHADLCIKMKTNITLKLDRIASLDVSCCSMHSARRLAFGCPVELVFLLHVRSGTQNDVACFRPRPALLVKVVIPLLLVAVAGLATVAKNGQYFPKQSAPYDVSISTKMNVAHSPAPLSGDCLQAAAILLLAPSGAVRVEKSPVAPVVVRMFLTDCEHHRAPPFSLA